MKAARDYLERKRVEKMRQATKKSLSGKKDAAAATPRPSSAGKGTGICYDFLAGKCTRGKDCKYKHEKAEKGKGGKKGKPRPSSRTPSRSMSPGSRSQVCKFWKAGKCHRGSECAFQHPPKPAAPSPKDDKRGKSKNKRKKKKKKKKKGDRSRSSSRGSNTSKGSQSRKEKGGKTSSGSAAVCLMRALVMVAAIDPTTSCHRVPEGIALPPFNHQFHLAMPVTPKRSVSFGDFVERYEIPIEHDCNLNPCSAKHVQSIQFAST